VLSLEGCIKDGAGLVDVLLSRRRPMQRLEARVSGEDLSRIWRKWKHPIRPLKHARLSLYEELLHLATQLTEDFEVEVATADEATKPLFETFSNEECTCRLHLVINSEIADMDFDVT